MSDARVTLPWISFYYRDFLASTIGWPTADRGAYVLLLFAQWETGPIDNDPDVLAAIAGMTSKEFLPMWRKRISQKFRDTSEGLLNERCEKEREKALTKRKNKQGAAAMARAIKAAKAAARATASNVVPIGGPHGR